MIMTDPDIIPIRSTTQRQRVEDRSQGRRQDRQGPGRGDPRSHEARDRRPCGAERRRLHRREDPDQAKRCG